MKHIKTPVQVCDSEIINLYYVRDADGDRLTTKITLEEAREIVATLNQRDDLVAQRDALAGACVVSRQLLADIAQYHDVILHDVGMDAMVRRVEQATRTALALVKGEQ